MGYWTSKISNETLNLRLKWKNSEIIGTLHCLRLKEYGQTDDG